MYGERQDGGMLSAFKDQNGELYPTIIVAGYLCILAIVFAWAFVFLPEDVGITKLAYLGLPTQKLNEGSVSSMISWLPTLLTIGGFYTANVMKDRNRLVAGGFSLVGMVAMAIDIYLDTTFKMAGGAGVVISLIDTIVFFTLFSEILVVMCAVIIVEEFGNFWDAIAAIISGESGSKRGRKKPRQQSRSRPRNEDRSFQTLGQGAGSDKTFRP